MKKGRLEAFSDGVIAIIITIMVLDLHVPHRADISDLLPVVPVLLCYVLSFVYIGIYWNNHHHMLYAVEKINGAVLWANLNLLFWLSMFPVITDWVGENHAASVPTALYGVVLLLAALSWWVLQRTIIAAQGLGSVLKRAVGADRKGRISPLLYALGVVLAFWSPPVSQGLYLLVALLWLIPDRRIERVVAKEQ